MRQFLKLMAVAGTVFVLVPLGIYTLAFGSRWGAKTESGGVRTAPAVLLSTRAVTNEGKGIAVDGFGNVYVAGITDGCFSTDVNGSGQSAFAMRCDANGKSQWVRQCGASEGYDCQAVAADGAGNVYITGFTPADHRDAKSRMFLVRYDPLGNRQWESRLGETGLNDGKVVAADAAGNSYVAGITTENPGGGTNGGQADVFVAKYDAAGALKWVRLYGAAGVEDPMGIALDPAGNIYVTGAANVSPQGEGEVFLVKFNPAGDQLWEQRLGRPNCSYACGIAVDPASNVCVAGYTYDDLDDIRNAGRTDLFAVKFSPAGRKLWTRLLGSESDDRGWGVAADPLGNIYVAGYSDGCFDGNPSAGKNDIVIVKFDADGRKLWSRQTGSRADDCESGLGIDVAGNLYLTGYTEGTMDGTARPVKREAFLAKFDAAGTRQWVRQMGAK